MGTIMEEGKISAHVEILLEQIALRVLPSLLAQGPAQQSIRQMLSDSIDSANFELDVANIDDEVPENVVNMSTGGKRHIVLDGTHTLCGWNWSAGKAMAFRGQEVLSKRPRCTKCLGRLSTRL